MLEGKSIFIKIEKPIPLTIFDEPVLKEQTTILFEKYEGDIKEKIYELLSLLEMEPCDALSCDNIATLFKVYFFKFILNETIEIIFSTSTTPKEYNVINVISNVLSEDKLAHAICGRPMYAAFAKAIHMVPVNHPFDTLINANKLAALKKHLTY